MLRALAVVVGLAPALLLAPAAAQDQWTVDDNGPADFVSIVAAVGSPLVGDGDVLRVEPGNYASFVTSKALAVIGRAGGALPTVGGESRVEDAGSFTLAGLDLSELLVRRVPGRFTVEDCEIGHTSSSTTGITETFLIEDCAEAVVSNSLLQGKTGNENDIESPGVSIENSRVALTNCEIHGGEGGDAGFTGFPGQPGVFIVDGSQVVVAACSVHGGHGGTADPPIEPCQSEGAAAIEVFDSTLWVKGNSSHVLDSGEDCPQGDSFAISGFGANVSVSGVAIEAPAFSGGLAVGGSLSQPAPPEPFLTLGGAPAPGGNRRLNLYGPAGSPALVLFSLQPLFATPPKIVGGPLWLDPAGQLLSLQLTLQGQSVPESVLLPLPATGAYAGIVVWVQAFVPAGGLQWRASNPASLVLRF